MEFVIIPRAHGAQTFETDPRFEPGTRDRIVQEVRRKAWRRDLRLKSEEPEAAWFRPNPAGAEKPWIQCKDVTDGGRPVWVWWGEHADSQ